MDFGVYGSRPPSARRPPSRTNPITGAEMVDGRQKPAAHQPASRPPSRPKPTGVPSLNLGIDDEDVMKQYDPYTYNLKSPGTASTVSWGTPKSSYDELERFAYKQTSEKSNRPKNVPSLHLQESARQVKQKPGSARKPVKKSAWDQPAVPEDLPPPSAHYQKQYAQYEQEMKDGYKNKHAGTKPHMAHTTQQMSELKLDLEAPRDKKVVVEDGMVTELQRAWTNNRYNMAQQRKRGDLADLEQYKRKAKMLETVMMDQLSRYVISDPEQDDVSGRATSHQPGMARGTVRTLHHSKVKTERSATENLLSKCVRFEARILTRVGRDALRDLMGFYFTIDNSLTIYEYRQFGKSHKGMPFILREQYGHMHGKRRGETYKLNEIYPGATLYLPTSGQPLSENLLRSPTLVIRISDTDEEARRQLLLEGVKRHEHEKVWQRLHLPPTKEEMQQLTLLKDIQGAVRRQLRKRGVTVMTGLSKMLRKADENGDGRLNKYELEKALSDFHIVIDQEKFDDLWEALDYDNTSFLDYGEFMRGVIGDMSEDRKHLVRKAFLKLDPSKRGFTTISDMRKFHTAHSHPKVKSGECTEEEIAEAFLSSFSHIGGDQQVSYHDFELYYEGLSIGIDHDQDFENILQNTWAI